MKRIATLVLSTIIAPMAALAQQSYPTKPLRIVVGFPPSSAADIVARLVAAKLSEPLGQSVVVENRPGAGSSIAAESVVRSPADGYTLMLGSSANAVNVSFYKTLSFDFAKDLSAISLVSSLPMVVAVHPSVPARTIQELIAIAKEKQGTMLYGSSGSGTSVHLAVELFNMLAGVKIGHVPYKGSPQSVTDLIAGRVQLVFAPISTVLPHAKSGALRTLASTGTKRSNATPDLPTVIEAGLAGFDAAIWFGLLAPAATSVDILDRLNAAIQKVAADPDIKAQLTAQGIDSVSGTRAEFGSFIRAEIEKWAKVVQASGVKAE